MNSVVCWNAPVAGRARGIGAANVGFGRGERGASLASGGEAPLGQLMASAHAMSKRALQSPTVSTATHAVQRRVAGNLVEAAGGLAL